jgi:hypothetical protein
MDGSRPLIFLEASYVRTPVDTARKTGRTTRLLSYALDVAAAGRVVLVFFPNLEWCTKAAPALMRTVASPLLGHEEIKKKDRSEWRVHPLGGTVEFESAGLGIRALYGKAKGTALLCDHTVLEDTRIATKWDTITLVAYSLVMVVL